MNHAAQLTDASVSHHFRFNIYRTIHKALRACMCDTLTKVATLDLDDTDDVARVMTQVEELAMFCTGHLQHENEFVHPAMEAREPGSCSNTAEDHVHHLQDIQKITELADAVRQSSSQKRFSALYDLQQHLALFVADNFAHMHIEETVNNGVLWKHYTDQEILAIEHAIVGSLSPDEFGMSLRWILMGASPAERAELLNGMRHSAPPPAFEAALAIARISLDARDWGKLEDALELNECLAA